MGRTRAALFNTILENGKLDDFLELATFLYREKRYKLFNSALIYVQRPGVLYVDTKTGWSRIGRGVKLSATPIVVMSPFGPVDFVYELEDTTGDRLPRRLRPDCLAEKTVPMDAEMYPRAVTMLNKLGISYSEKPLGTRLHGEATLLPTEKLLLVSEKKEEVRTRYEVVINPNKTDTGKVLTILHEAGHILCGHIRDPKNKYLAVPDRSRDKLTPAVMEYEAEMVCRMFAKVLGYEYDPSAYMAQYREDDYEESFSLRFVMDAVDKILMEW